MAGTIGTSQLEARVQKSNEAFGLVVASASDLCKGNLTIGTQEVFHGLVLGEVPCTFYEAVRL